MGNGDDNRYWWRFFDGSASVSVGMLVAVAFRYCGFCDDIPILGFINGLTRDDDGVIIVATLLLFPTTAALYGGLKMFFAAKEAVEKKARERGRREGRQEGPAGNARADHAHTGGARYARNAGGTGPSPGRRHRLGAARSQWQRPVRRHGVRTVGQEQRGGGCPGAKTCSVKNPTSLIPCLWKHPPLLQSN